MDELFEMLTWGQLGLHQKPIGVLNVDGYYDTLNLLTENMIANGFLSLINRESLMICEDVDLLLEQMGNYHAAESPSVIGKDKI